MVVYPEFGSGLAYQVLESLTNYAVATQPIPWDTWAENLKNKPKKVIYCTSMEQSELERLAEEHKGKYDWVVGIGGGVGNDTGKFLAMKWGAPLITIPSIISVDAFLCAAVGVRNESRVRYINAPEAKRIIIDYDLIRSAPAYLNHGGVGDVLSCTTALGDWLIARDEFGDKFDQQIFDDTVKMVKVMFNAADEIHSLSDLGIKKLVNDFLLGEVILSERWGNARPEEGGEHFLAYCIEKIAPRQYLHGSLIGMCALIVLKLQGKYAQFSIDEVKNFLDAVGLQYTPHFLKLERTIIERALKKVQDYVAEEHLFHGLWSRKNPFTEASIEQTVDWLFKL